MKGRTGAIALLAAPLLIVAGLLAVILLVFVPSTQANACGASRLLDLADVPDGPIAGYTGEQLDNAAAIMNAGASAGFQRDAQTIAVMVAMAESGLRVLEAGTAQRPDGLGLFLQPDDPAWGTSADRLDPQASSLGFYRALAGLGPWQQLEPTVAAHRIQGGDDPFRFESFYAPAAEVVGTLAGGGQVVCQSGYLVFPLEPGFQMTSPYGYRGQVVPGQTINPWHAAVDLQNWPGPCGQPVYAITAGKVTVVAGYQVSIKSPDGYTVSYLHMWLPDVMVDVGDDVIAGQQIGRVGNNGPSTGCHLDLRVNVIGNTNPLLDDLPRAENDCTNAGGRRVCGPVGFVHPEAFYDAFGVELCPADTCRRTY